MELFTPVAIGIKFSGPLLKDGNIFPDQKVNLNLKIISLYRDGNYYVSAKSIEQLTGPYQGDWYEGAAFVRQVNAQMLNNEDGQNTKLIKLLHALGLGGNGDKIYVVRADEILRYINDPQPGLTLSLLQIGVPSRQQLFEHLLRASRQLPVPSNLGIKDKISN